MTRVFLILACLSLAACRGGNNPDYSVAYSVAGGDPQRGREVIQARNCGRCHTIPGVRAARGVVAPPLMWFSRRSFIAGELANTPDNLAAWIRLPQAIEPATAMPALGLSDQEARDAAAYLSSLR
jgi:cytochrome c1